MLDKKYYIVKNKNDKAITYFEYDKMEGYDLTPKKGMKIEDAINVNKVVIINPSLAEKVAKKKFDLKHLDFTDERNEFDPVQTDVTDSDYLFDNEDAIVVNLNNKNKKKM